MFINIINANVSGIFIKTDENYVLINGRVYEFDNVSRAIDFNKFWNQNNPSHEDRNIFDYKRVLECLN